MKWDTLSDAATADMNEYYKGLIAFRKAHGALRMPTTEEIQANLHFMDAEQANVVAYTIDNSPNGEIAEKIMVVYKGNPEAVEMALPEGAWNICINGQQAGTEVLATAEGTVSVDGISAMVLLQGDTAPAASLAGSDDSSVVGPIVAVVAVLGICGGALVLKKKKSK